MDYSIMSDAAIVRHITAHGLGCGRFREDQLDRDMVGEQPAKQRWQQWLVAGLSAAFSFGVKEAAAYEPHMPPYHQSPNVPGDTTRCAPGIAIIRGRVVGQTGEPIVGAVVSLDRTRFTDTTDINGVYEICTKYARWSGNVTVQYQGAQVFQLKVVLRKGRITYQNIRINDGCATITAHYTRPLVDNTRGGGTIKQLTSEQFEVIRSPKKRTFWQRIQFWKRHR